MGCPRSTSGRVRCLGGLLARDEAFVGHPRQHVVVAPRERAVRVDERTEPRRRLDDGGDGRGLFERQVLRRLVEVHPRGRLDAVRAVSEIDLVGVEREDLGLGVAPLELHRHQHFLHLALDERPARAHEHAVDHVLVEEQIPRELLRDGAGAEALAVDDVLDGRDDDARDAQAEVLLEVAVFAGDDRLTQHRRHVVVADDDAAFDRELADHPFVAREQAGDRVRLVVVERADLRNVVGEREEHAADGAEHGGDDEERDQIRRCGRRAARSCCVASRAAEAVRRRDRWAGRREGSSL